MPLIALKELVYGGKTIAEGEEFETHSPKDERTLIAIRKAKLAEEKKAGKKAAKVEADDTDEITSAKAVEAKSTAKDAVDKTAKYETRKMTAKDDN